MESSTQHVGSDEVGKLIPVAAKPPKEEPVDPSRDLYAQAELERRHERYELMIEKAHKAS